MNLYVDPPKKVSLTKEEFYSLNFWDLSVLFVNWEVCLEELEDGGVKIFTMSERFVDLCENNHRFRGLKLIFPREGLFHCTLPAESDLNKIARKYLVNYFFKT